MGTEQTAAAAAAVSAEPSIGDAGLSLAGLIDVLDRADDALGPRRPRPRRAVVHRSPAMRMVADRWDPLRESSPYVASRPGALRGTPSRPVPLRTVQLHSVRPAPAARVPAPAVPPMPPRPAPAPEPPRGLRAALRSLVRRVALWGAGPGGVHLAWGAPTPSPVYRPGAIRTTPSRAADRRPLDPPVVLRELPSTPTNRPAAPSPAAAGGTTAPRVERWVRPGSVGRLPARLPAPRRSVPTRARSPGGIRGSPGSVPARGSPPWEPEPGRSSEAPRGTQPLDAVPRSATSRAESDRPTSPG